MSQKKPVMGRGLEALLGQMTRRPEPAPGTPAQPASPESGAAAPAEHKFPGDELANLPLDLLQRGKYQPRIDMRQESLQELAESIKAQGVVQPIVVRPVDGAAPGASQRYEIIAGERRWRAAQIAGLPTVPAVIRRVPDEAAIAMSLIENIQRENLNPLEEARALERLISEFGVTHQQAADAVGRSRAAVSNLLRLLELRRKSRLWWNNASSRWAMPVRCCRSHSAATRWRSACWSRRRAFRYAKPRRWCAACWRAPPVAATRRNPGPSIRTCNACRTSCPRNSARSCRSSTVASGKGKVVVSYHSLDELDGILAHIR